MRGSSQQPSLAGNFPTKTRPVVRLHPLSNQASRSQTTTECPGLCPVGRVKTHDFSAAKMTRPEKIEAEVVQCRQAFVLSARVWNLPASPPSRMRPRRRPLHHSLHASLRRSLGLTAREGRMRRDPRLCMLAMTFRPQHEEKYRDLNIVASEAHSAPRFSFVQFSDPYAGDECVIREPGFQDRNCMRRKFESWWETMANPLVCSIPPRCMFSRHLWVNDIYCSIVLFRVIEAASSA